MRLRTFTAPTLSEAMARIRRDMGPDAIIISTQEGLPDLGCRVIAAIEESPVSELPEDGHAPLGRDERDALLRQILVAHGLPPGMADALLASAAEVDDPDPSIALAAAIDTHAAFHRFDIAAQKAPLVLAGMPGAGKTITAAKIAASAKLGGKSLFIASADGKRAGGIEQLAVFTRILGVELATVRSATDLAAHADAIAAADIALIDTRGVNPFDDDDMMYLQTLSSVIGGELLLVMAAGGDAMESADTAAAFRDIGAKRMIVTRIDMTRRLGGVLAAAVGGRIGIAGAGIDPNVADGLGPLNPVSLARLMLPDDDVASQPRQSKAMP